jgi:hypothetical protein
MVASMSLATPRALGVIQFADKEEKEEDAGEMGGKVVPMQELTI